MRLGRLRAVRWQEASIIFQGAMHGLNPVRTVGDQVAEAILTHDPGKETTAKKRVVELFDQVGLAERRVKDYPHELSGGMKQRVMIAMALALDPQIVIADEPTTALDVMVQAQVLRLLKRLQAELGLSMIFITHDLSVLVDVCDRIAVMYAGKVVEIGAAEDVFLNPLHPYTHALSKAFPDIGDHTFRMKPVGLGGDPPDPQHVPAGCSFHPRCPIAADICRSEEPTLSTLEPNRLAACLLATKESAQ
jgi:peptide/nickel transport system ATP-binding protein